MDLVAAEEGLCHLLEYELIYIQSSCCFQILFDITIAAIAITNIIICSHMRYIVIIH